MRSYYFFIDIFSEKFKLDKNLIPEKNNKI